MTIIKRESSDTLRFPWMQFLVVTDGRVAIVEMTPALLGGWNIGKVSIQDGYHWEGWSEASIVEFKHADARACIVTGTLSEDFRRKLLDAAGVAP